MRFSRYPDAPVLQHSMCAANSNAPLPKYLHCPNTHNRLLIKVLIDGILPIMDLEKLKTECRITTFRSSGPGGQHRNVTDSAVRLKHLPTGIIVVGQSHRSQHRNLQDALERLAKKLEDREKRRKPRIPTRKSRAVRAREMEGKRRRGVKKKLRSKVKLD